MREQYGDAKHTALIDGTGTATESAMTDSGDDLGGDDLGGDDLGGDDLGGGEEEDAGPLLAEPGQRDDGYIPVKLDRRSGSGPRKRSALASAGEKAAYPGQSRLFKGVAGELGPLGRGIVSAGLVKREEDLITETNKDIKTLITQLDKKHEDKT